MCSPFQTPNMLTWLKAQVRVLEAWRENVAMHPELDLEMISRLEQHYQWLTREICYLDSLSARPSSARRFASLKAV